MNDDFDDTNTFPRIRDQHENKSDAVTSEAASTPAPLAQDGAPLPEFTPTGDVPKPSTEEARRAALVPDGTAALVNPPTEILAIPSAKQRAEDKAKADLSGVRATTLSDDGVERELFGPGVPSIPDDVENETNTDGEADTGREVNAGRAADSNEEGEADNDAFGLGQIVNDSDPKPVAADEPSSASWPTDVFGAADPATQVIKQNAEATTNIPERDSSVAGGSTLTFASTADAAKGITPTDISPTDITPTGDKPKDKDSVPGSKRKRGILIGIGIGIVVLAGAYGGAAFMLADQVPGGTTVAGIDISKQSADDAAKTLNAKLKSRTSEPLELTMGEQSVTVVPSESGLTFDAKATVAKVTGFSLNPTRLIEHISGGRAVAPVTKVDSAKLDTAIASASGSLATEPVDGSVAFENAAVVAVPAQTGLKVEDKKAKEFLTETWLTGKVPVVLPSVETEPAITQAMVDEAVSGPAAALLSGPVTVSINNKPVELPPEAMAAHASFAPADGKLALAMNGEGLVGEVLGRTDKIGAEAVNASVKIENGAPVITGGQVGMTIDPAVLSQVVSAAATSTSERNAVATMTESEPEVTKADVEALGIKEIIGTQSINLTSDSVRTNNLRIAAGAVNGTLLMPGDTFSLCKKIDGATVAKGYGAAGVISNGIHKNEVGGGLSQMSTTLYGAAFYSGLEDVTHKAHSEYINRYPAGQESTLYCPDLDMQFKNNTKFGVLIQAWVADGQTHAAFWSTKTWDKIEAVPGPKTNQQSPGIHRSKDPKCSPSSAGNSGFRIVVTRNFYRGGVVAQSDSVTTTYKPVNQVVCEP